MFRAVSDGVTNNDAAFAAINAFVQDNGSCILYLSGRSYALTQWDIPEQLMVKGPARKTQNWSVPLPSISRGSSDVPLRRKINGNLPFLIVVFLLAERQILRFCCLLTPPPGQFQGSF
jgi:hypothetical protein